MGAKWKRNTVVATMLVLVCAAVGLNWKYSGEAAKKQVQETGTKILGEATLVSGQGTDEEAVYTGSDYFASARLTRQQSRDEALSLLESAASSESASQETIDSAMESIAAMATWSMQETQIENLLLAKDFDDCVVYMSGEGITVAVPAPEEGLAEASVARITDTITTETEFQASQIKIIEVKDY